MTLRRKPLLALVLGLLVPFSSLGAQNRIEAITRPSKDVVLSFVRPGRVAKVLVKEGDKVKAGQELVRLDDEAELAQLEQLKAQAEDETRVKAAEAQLAQRKVDLKQKNWAFDHGAATKMEVEHAQLEVMISELSLKLAEFQHKQDQRKYEEAKIQHIRMRISSPIDGAVERVLVEPGESADAQKEIIRVVKIDPLWADVPVPLSQARGLRKGTSNVVVEFMDEGSVRPPRVAARIIHVAAVADAASATLTVRIEVPNPTARPAGEKVYVSFPAVDKAARPGKATSKKVAARPRKQDRSR